MLLSRFLRAFVGFLILDEAPNLVGFNVLDRYVDDQPAHELFAALTGQRQESMMVL